jgi:hypothetical protein
LAKKNADIQWCYFNENSQPQYVLLDNEANLLAAPKARDLDAKSYGTWLQNGVDLYQLRMKDVIAK